MSSGSPADRGAFSWYAVHTRPRREETVRAHLVRARIPVFLPKIRETRWRGKERTHEIHPLFPGYLFASFEPVGDRDKVRWAPGVKRIVGYGEDPVSVEACVIRTLRARHGTREYIVARRTLRRGERVRVRGGPLAGLMGIVDAPCSGEERVRVLLDLFRQSVRVEMEAASVAQAN